MGARLRSEFVRPPNVLSSLTDHLAATRQYRYSQPAPDLKYLGDASTFTWITTQAKDAPAATAVALPS